MVRWLLAVMGALAAGSMVAQAEDELPAPVRIAVPETGHIHPAICRGPRGTLVVIYGRVNHRDLRITRSTDGGQTFSAPAPFVHTEGKTYYPGSLTSLSDGRMLHCWNRWSADDNEREPRSVLYSLSSDEGLTWSQPKAFFADPEVRCVIRHPVIELAPDRWLVATSDRAFVFNPRDETTEPWGGGAAAVHLPLVRTAAGTFISGTAGRSTDGGQTWQPIAGLPDVADQWWRHELAALSNGWVLASEILGPGFGGERIRYAISRDDGLSWTHHYEFHNPGRAIGGRACPRTIQLDERTLGVVFYDISPEQPGGPGLFFLAIPLARLAR